MNVSLWANSRFRVERLILTGKGNRLSGGMNWWCGLNLQRAARCWGEYDGSHFARACTATQKMKVIKTAVWKAGVMTEKWRMRMKGQDIYNRKKGSKFIHLHSRIKLEFSCPCHMLGSSPAQEMSLRVLWLRDVSTQETLEIYIHILYILTGWPLSHS